MSSSVDSTETQGKGIGYGICVAKTQFSLSQMLMNL